MEFKTGTYVGTGAALNIEVGFIPDKVEVFNYSDAGSLWPSAVWQKGLPAASMLKSLKVVDSGSTGNASQAYVTSDGISTYAGTSDPVALAGTVSTTAGSSTVTGSGTAFTTALKVGDLISIGQNVVPLTGTGGLTGSLVSALQAEVVAIASATSLTIKYPADRAITGKTAMRLTGRKAGFTLGADADLNAAGEAGVWVAYKEL